MSKKNVKPGLTSGIAGEILMLSSVFLSSASVFAQDSEPANQNIQSPSKSSQIEDFLKALENNTQPIVTGEDGRKTVELFTSIYRSARDKTLIKFPLKPENKPDMDGRIT